jgi:dTDP-4-amino-4,6-dideoxygalactose transaminase
VKIFLSLADIGPVEREAVGRAMESGWVAPAGPDLDAFEREVAERVGVDHAVALSSGTAALHLPLVSWGVGPGDLVITSTLTFAATANAITYVGASPHFVDSDPATGNMDPALLERALAESEADGRNVAAVIPVDLLGKAADYTAIGDIASSYDVPLLCDAAESFGASHAGRPTGSFGDASVLSFNGNKIMTTSGGGMLLTDNQRLADHVRKLSTQAREPALHYEHAEVGYNYRLSNVLAALGRAQLARLDEMIARRRVWRERYRRLFDLPGISLFGGADDAEDNCWLTAIVVDSDTTGWSAADLGLRLSAQGIESRPIWKPMHLQPVFADAPATLTGVAERLFRNGLTLPSGSSLSDDEFGFVEEAISTAIGDLS